jgi:flagellar biosynthesis anti-sigma factor FlgM
MRLNMKISPPTSAQAQTTPAATPSNVQLVRPETGSSDDGIQSELSAAQQQLAAMDNNNVDMNKVEQIRQAVARGEINTNSHDLAAAMIQYFRG